MKVLVLNAGSSSLKFRLTAAAAGGVDGREITGGALERIGAEVRIRDHGDAVRQVVERLRGKEGPGRIGAVGHRSRHSRT